MVGLSVASLLAGGQLRNVPFRETESGRTNQLHEVLLLSRIQEEYRRTGDNTAAVAMGLERSGRLITGAAAIMVGVFIAFALADVVIIKSVGLGLTIAVALDATLIRALVVPATMRLLGRANWWAPGPLARLGMHLEPASATIKG
jgi:uncharacterized membrane protein YdfJ with MMPL/SSD domain